MLKFDSVDVHVGIFPVRGILVCMAGGEFYDGWDDFLTSKFHPAGYFCSLGGYHFGGDTLLHDTGLRVPVHIVSNQ